LDWSSLCKAIGEDKGSSITLVAVWAEMKNSSSSLEVEATLAAEVVSEENPRSPQTQQTTTTALWDLRETLIKRRLRRLSKS